MSFERFVDIPDDPTIWALLAKLVKARLHLGQEAGQSGPKSEWSHSDRGDLRELHARNKVVASTGDVGTGPDDGDFI